MRNDIMLWFALVFGVLFCSCTQNNQSDPETVAAMRRAIEFSHQELSMTNNQLDLAYVIDPVKAKPYHNNGQRIQHSISVLVELLDLATEQQPLSDTLSARIQQELGLVKDSLLAYNLALESKASSTKEDIAQQLSNVLSDPAFAQRSELATLIMLNDLLMLANTLTRDQLRCINVEEPWFIAFDVTTTSAPNQQGMSHIFELQSPWMQMVKNKWIEIDTVLHDQNLLQSNAITRLDPTFATVSFDSLKAGDYDVRGHVQWINDLGEERKSPFQHTFKIEKANSKNAGD